MITSFDRDFLNTSHLDIHTCICRAREYARWDRKIVQPKTHRHCGWASSHQDFGHLTTSNLMFLWFFLPCFKAVLSIGASCIVKIPQIVQQKSSSTSLSGVTFILDALIGNIFPGTCFEASPKQISGRSCECRLHFNRHPYF